MSVAVVTGSSGLVGSETVKFLHEKGMEVVGIDNNMREYFFGKDGSVEWNTLHLKRNLKRFQHYPIDIRDSDRLKQIFEQYRGDISIVVHTAAQPSHDWAAREPVTDFTVNAQGTLTMLEATRQYCQDAVFILTSTNKVYGDTPNSLPFIEKEARWEVDPSHPYARYGIDETMSIDQTMHSLFGVSKVSADILTQEYGRYFGMKTGVFRAGCITGPAHSGAELHGFLAYLVKCCVTGRPYVIYGYKGKQVRDNIHAYDLVNAFWHFYQQPREGAVYNIGGSRYSNCSLMEAIQLIQELVGKPLVYELSDAARAGDHIWWISDIRQFRTDYPGWYFQYDVLMILKEIVNAVVARH
jgi:CDP-paratose 2-epimerase